MHAKALQSHLTLRPYRALWAPLSIGYSSKNTGMGCCALLWGICPGPRDQPMSLKSPALVGGFFTTSTAWEALQEEGDH